ncbi:MAG: glutamate--tRNA ligase [Clostridia bacterium]|nr:glutamate--tRNA ligase [Clostridia bacterium]
MKEVRTRFAPSPTGFMHIGNLRTALYAYLFARANGGKFILRIEDTDRERYVEGAVDIIYSTLRKAGMSHDEGPDRDGGYGPYVQSERKPLYMEYAKKLVELGGAYYCFCTKERLESLTDENGNRRYDKHCLSLSKEEVEARINAGEPFVIRQNVPTEGVSEYDDLVYGHISVPCADLEDNILIKSDGMPTYNFANVIDDHLMNITHVIRGTEYLSSTPKYNLVYDSFGWERPEYMHLPPIMKDKERKLSKRYGDANFEDFLAKGYLPEAIINYIALLGWSPKDNNEKFTIKELEERFSVVGINKSSSIFDEAKMRWLNGEYIRELSPDKFLELATPYLDQSKVKGLYDYSLLAPLLQPRVEILSEIPSIVNFLEEYGEFDPALYEHKKMKTDIEFAKTCLPKILEALQSITDWTGENVHEALSALAENWEGGAIKIGKLMWCLRIAITGQAVTPGGSTDMTNLLGKDRTIDRLNKAIGFLA